MTIVVKEYTSKNGTIYQLKEFDKTRIYHSNEVRSTKANNAEYWDAIAKDKKLEQMQEAESKKVKPLSDDEKLLAAFASGEDLHATVAGLVFGVKPSEVDPEMRRQMKAMSYGLAYGLSSYGLAAQLDITPPAAQQLMDTYFERFGGIRDYLKTVVEDARKVGYTETIMGRRRYLPDLMHDNRQRREVAERMALNAPIQGSAADIIKVAMLNVQRAIEKEGLKSRLLLQIHDELILEVVAGEEEKISALVKREMGSAYPLKAPLDVNAGLGLTWHEAAH